MKGGPWGRWRIDCDESFYNGRLTRRPIERAGPELLVVSGNKAGRRFAIVLCPLD
jgi:hypothetical protein